MIQVASVAEAAVFTLGCAAIHGMRARSDTVTAVLCAAMAAIAALFLIASLPDNPVINSDDLLSTIIEIGE